MGRGYNSSQAWAYYQLFSGQMTTIPDYQMYIGRSYT